MVTPVEFDNLVPSRKRARETNARHGRFCAAIYHPHFLDRRHPVANQFRQFHFKRIWNSKAQATRGGFAHCIHNDFWRMAENRRPPTADVIDVFISIDIPNPRTFRARDEERLAANIAKCADW